MEISWEVFSVSVAPNDYKADIQSKSHNLKDLEIKKDNF